MMNTEVDMKLARNLVKDGALLEISVWKLSLGHYLFKRCFFVPTASVLVH